MACAKCQEHRRRIGEAVKVGSVKGAVKEIVSAAATIGENAGRKLIRKGRK